MNETRIIKGRGATANPANRFEPIRYERDPDADPDDEPRPRTQFFRDDTQSIIARNNSADIPFDSSINPYRGCEHGCIYCYARPGHEFLGMSAGLDFETRIMVKERAPELLQAALSKPSWKPQPIAISGVTDAWQPIERKLRITRRCLEILCEFRNPVMAITKNALVTRDVDLFAELARHDAAVVSLSVTTLDRKLAQLMEPRTAMPERRLEAIAALAEAGVPVSVMIGPVIPGLTDHEMPRILEAAAAAGAESASYVMLRLPPGVDALFEGWLDAHFPDRKGKVMDFVRRTSRSALTQRQVGRGHFAELAKQLFDLHCSRLGLSRPNRELSTAAFRRVDPLQPMLF